MNNITKFFNEILVYDNDLTKVRIGNRYDGGYILLEELCEKAPMLYSFGIGDDCVFEWDFVSRFPASAKLFDPYIQKLPLTDAKFTFINKGIGTVEREARIQLYDVEQDSILKMDIENGEWSAFDEMDEEELKKFSQMVIEFHIVHVEVKNWQGLSPYFRKFYERIYGEMNEESFGVYYEIIRKIKKYFYCFHIHANNSLPLSHVGGFDFPPLLEMSFVRKDFGKNIYLSKEPFPIEELDSPNKTDRPDVTGFYPFIRERPA